MTETETLCNGDWLRLKRRGRWEYAERTNPGGGVMIIAVTPEDRIVFVEQYRPAIAAAGAMVAELPRLWLRPHDESLLPRIVRWEGVAEFEVVVDRLNLVPFGRQQHRLPACVFDRLPRLGELNLFDSAVGDQEGDSLAYQ